MFSLLMCSHKVDVTYIDEISEALKNCALGFDAFINRIHTIPVAKFFKIKDDEKLL